MIFELGLANTEVDDYKPQTIEHRISNDELRMSKFKNLPPKSYCLFNPETTNQYFVTSQFSSTLSVLRHEKRIEVYGFET